MNNSGQKILIYGCGGHARSVAGVLIDKIPSVNIIFVDRNAKDNEKIFNFPVVKEYNKDLPYHIAIGDNEKRKNLNRTLNKTNLVSIISDRALVDKTVNIKKGCFIAHLAYMAPLCSIGTGTIINTRATIEHEVKIGEFCHIAPSTTICGRSSIGDNVIIGAGATVIDYIEICSDVIIGAGAVVTKDITESGVYVGTPVRKINKN